jgi:hypothetical protein
MPSKNSCYKKVIFRDRISISRTPASRSLIVIIEIQGDQPDSKEFEIINFANSIVRLQIVNEGWEGTEKSLQHIEFNELPVLGKPAKEEGDYNHSPFHHCFLSATTYSTSELLIEARGKPWGIFLASGTRALMRGTTYATALAICFELNPENI